MITIETTCAPTYRAAGRPGRRSLAVAYRDAARAAWRKRYPCECERETGYDCGELTDVRVERVQSISDADIAAEGVTAEAAIDLFFEKRPVGVSMPLAGPMRPIDAWRIGWSAINGAESWAANPWVWVLGFRRVE